MGAYPEVINSVLMGAWVLVLFGVLLVCAERFFCPALEVLSDHFALSPDVAGATLLSFGNGAPDVFTQIAALSASDVSAASTAIGEPIGGGMFVSNIVLALVVLLGVSRAGIAVERGPFLRDTIFYLGALLLVLLIASDGTVWLLEGVALLAYYSCYVCYTVLRNQKPPLQIEQSRYYQHITHSQALCHTAALRCESTITVLRHASHPSLSVWADCEPCASDNPRGGSAGPGGASQPADVAALRRAHSAADALAGSPSLFEHTTSISPPFLPRARDSASPRGPFVDEEKVTLPCSHDDSCEQDDVAVGPFPLMGAVQFEEPLLPAAASSHLSHSGGADSASWANRLKDPLVCLMRLTMPEVGMHDNVRYPKPFAVLLPITAPLFVVIVEGLALQPGSPLGWRALLYGLACSLFSSLVIWSIYPSSGRHYGILSGVFTAMTFSVSMLWMSVAAGELVTTCKSLGFAYGLSQSMLGVTVLAWGNSIGDMIANVAMSRDGFPEMATAACFASPLFSLSAGLGLAIVANVIRSGTLHFGFRLPLEVAILFAVASTLRYIVMIPSVYGFKLTRSSAWVAIAFYAVFQVVYLYFIAHREPDAF